MTRINLVEPSELSDQHLFAEFREIKMVPKALARSLKARGLSGVICSVPSEFTLNKGHVTFFYDKGEYLRSRYDKLKEELELRQINYNKLSQFDPDNVYGLHPELNRDYNPTSAALKIIRERIAQKIAMKPDWYRFGGHQSE